MTACLAFPVSSFQQTGVTDSCGNASTSEVDITLPAKDAPEVAERVKRPMNAFMVWSTKRRKVLSMENPNIHNSKLSKLLGTEWKSLSDEKKDPYRKKAQKIREQHRKAHPGYTYPTTKRRRQVEGMMHGDDDPMPCVYAEMARRRDQPMPPQYRHGVTTIAGRVVPVHQISGHPVHMELGQHAALGNPVHAVPVYNAQVRSPFHRKFHVLPRLITTDSLSQHVPLHKDDHIIHHLPSFAGNSLPISQPPATTFGSHSSLNHLVLDYLSNASLKQQLKTSRVDRLRGTSPDSSPMTSDLDCSVNCATVNSTMAMATVISTTVNSAPAPVIQSTTADHSVQVIQYATTFADSSVQVTPVQLEEQADTSKIDHSVEVIRSPTSFTDHTVQITPLKQQLVATSSQQQPTASSLQQHVATLQPAASSQQQSATSSRQPATSTFTRHHGQPATSSRHQPSTSSRQQPATSSRQQPATSEEHVTDSEDDSVQIIKVEHSKTSFGQGKNAVATPVLTPVPLMPIVHRIDSSGVAVQPKFVPQQQGIDYIVHKAILLSTYRATRLAIPQDTTGTEGTLLPNKSVGVTTLSQNMTTPIQGVATPALDVSSPIEDVAMPSPTLNLTTPTQDIPAPIQDVTVPSHDVTMDATKSTQTADLEEIDVEEIGNISQADMAIDVTTPTKTIGENVTTPIQDPVLSETDYKLPSVVMSTASATFINPDSPPPSKRSAPMPPLLLVCPSPMQATPTTVVPVTSHVWTLTSHTVTPSQSNLRDNSAIWS